MPQFYAVEQGKKMRMVMNEPDFDSTHERVVMVNPSGK